MAIITLNNRATNRSDTASAGQVFTATSATASDFQSVGANTPAFLAHVNSSTQTIANNTTVKITNYNTEIFDTHNAFASGEFTVPSGGAGRYFLSGSISSDTGTQMLAKQFNIQIKAGSTVYASVTILRPPYAQLVISTITQLSEGQTVSMNMYQDSGSTVSLEGGRRTFFGGFRLIS